MAEIYKQPYQVSLGFGANFYLEPPITWNGKYYEHFHRGIDLVATPNAPLYAAQPGVVYAAGTDTDGAKYVIELADSGHWMLYWHLSVVLVRAGQRVDNSTQLGNQGSTGKSTGQHTHFEVDQPQPWPGGALKLTPVDPTPFLKGGEAGEPDMNPRILIDALYKISQPNAQPTEEVRNNHAAYINGMAPDQLAGWLNSFIEPGTGYLSARQAVDALYDALPYNTPPEVRGAKVGSLLSGFSFSTLIKEAAPVEALEGQLKAANQTNATLRANISAEAQKLAAEQLSTVQDDAFKVAYRTQARQDPSKKEIAQWRETDLSADQWVIKNVPNADIQQLQSLLDASNGSVGKLNDTISQQKRQLEELTTKVGTIEQTILEVTKQVGGLKQQLKAEQLVSETLRTKLEAERQKAKPIQDLTVIQLVIEAFNRLRGGAKT